MCAILDNNSWSEVFSRGKPPAGEAITVGSGGRPASSEVFSAGEAFRDWLMRHRGFLVLGGRLRTEVTSGVKRKLQIQQLQLGGIVVPIPDAPVNEAETALVADGSCVSDDEHIIALAKVSGARLLYSKDGDLHSDFTNPRLLSRGRVYSTMRGPELTAGHKRLLKTHRCHREGALAQSGSRPPTGGRRG